MTISLAIPRKEESPRLVQVGAGSIAVSLSNVSKRFGDKADSVVTLDRLTLHVQAGEFLCLVGASGGGKSTLLNLVAGLERPSSGSVEVNQARTALMFQEAALFPWMTVEENIEFPMRVRRIARSQRRDTVESLLETMAPAWVRPDAAT